MTHEGSHVNELTDTETVLLATLLADKGLPTVLTKIGDILRGALENGASHGSNGDQVIDVVKPEDLQDLPEFREHDFTEVNGKKIRHPRGPYPRHKRFTRYPESRRQEIRSLSSQGETVANIARKFRMDVSTVYYIIKHPPTPIGKRA